MAATQLSARYSQDVRFESGGFVSQTNPPALEGTGVSLLGGLPITYVRVGLRCGLWTRSSSHRFRIQAPKDDSRAYITLCSPHFS